MRLSRIVLLPLKDRTAFASSSSSSGWVFQIPASAVSDPSSWPPLSGRYFDWARSTDEFYQDPGVSVAGGGGVGGGRFEAARGRLDYMYHRRPAPPRSGLQDAILGRVVDATSSLKATGEGEVSSDGAQQYGKRPWIVFTAGCMGSGKGYVLTTLHRAGLFPLDGFLKIDPDMLKNELPEMAGYLREDPSTAATKLHHESSLMADVLLEQALLSLSSLDKGFGADATTASAAATAPSVLVDGSLRDVDWYSYLFTRIRSLSSPLGLSYRIAILHVTCNLETALERARRRAEITGRVVPEKKLRDAFEAVPRSVRRLAPLADACYEIGNNEGRPFRLREIRSSLSGCGEGEGSKSGSGGHDELDASPWLDFARTWVEDDDRRTAYNTHLRADEGRLPLHPSDPGDIVCRLSETWDDSEAHAAASAVWGSAYPNFCARCALTCDGQCGVCIHGRHVCACLECSIRGRRGAA